ncbi:O-acetyl-ADP-ribose deacetylase [Baaleninema simplex]|uniref:O-acetyl-ADP-ribose deacetylase n=1 Tax=Baaleninema simplex TaxID=2862350 RepID=UPI00034BCE59|nr:O-acetyl-ADP-ribose deacetylase [Baaleninema simplex]
MEVVLDDITKLKVDAIVNAANTSLLGGGGVDGAIHRAAGPELVNECRLLAGCQPGEAKLTRGYRLFARYVIHTVGPVWQGGCKGEPDILSRCYRSCFDLAIEREFKSIAFPCISTGVYGYPKLLAAEVAIASYNNYFCDRDRSLNVIFCCYDREDYNIYKNLQHIDNLNR